MSFLCLEGFVSIAGQCINDGLLDWFFHELQILMVSKIGNVESSAFLASLD
jgi:hypothetical protein